MSENNTTRLADHLEALDTRLLTWADVAIKTRLSYKINELKAKDLRSIRKSLLSRKYIDKEGKAKQYKPLEDRIGRKLRKRNEDLTALAFTFPRHGIFFERGVGQHRKVGSESAEKAKKIWLASSLPDAIEELAAVIVEEYADIAVAELKINIPGAVSTKVTL